ncbi:MAG: DUF3047 domain-containing protein [bacterium]|nr:DUF3047 domain-containing protein [bacterium]
MFKRIFGFLLIPLVLSFGSEVLGNTIQVDELSKSKVGEFPTGWETFPFQKGKARKVYSIQENHGRKYIRALDNQNISVIIYRNFPWDLEKYPYLKFRWRAQRIPNGARETDPKKNDSACGVYLGFTRTQILKYVWSDTLNPGTWWAKVPGKYTLVAKEKGERHQGQWREVTIHVKKDYERYFGKKLMKNPMGVGILTDGNALKTTSACDYGGFWIASKP